MGAVLFLVGFWLIRRIPNGPGPLPWKAHLVAMLPLAGLVILHLVYRLRGKPAAGTAVGVRVRVRTLELVYENGRVKPIPWTTFDAFDLLDWQGFTLLALRLRDTWPFRIWRPSGIWAIDVGSPAVDMSRVRQVLMDRGIVHASLGAPTV
jgi:hypothetical protein